MFKKRRGRKRKIDKLLEQVEAAQTVPSAHTSSAQRHTSILEAKTAALMAEAQRKAAALAMEAQIKAQTQAAISNRDSLRVPVVNIEDGSRLSGDEAPMKRDLDKWLNEHPEYMVDKPDHDSSRVDEV